MIFNNSMNTEGTGSKRKALEMITNIFCKKTKEAENLGINSEPVTNNDNYCSNRNLCQQSLSIPEANTHLGHSDILPKSPISPRVKNFDRDMEALTLSRQDNPYIMQQLERLSVTNEYLTELSVSTHSSPARSFQRITMTTNEHITSDPNFIMDSEDFYDDNLHDKLIRSPPPNFPQKLSLFVFPDSSAGSIHSYSLSKTRDQCDDSPSRAMMSPTFIHSRHGLKEKSLDSKSRISNMSNDSILDDLSARHASMHLRENHYLSASPNNYLKYERRGSDSSIMNNCRKAPFYNPSMAASSSSLMSFVPRCSAINSYNCLYNQTNNGYQYRDNNQEEEEDKSKFEIDSFEVMDMYSNYDDNSANQMSFISPSNSQEALLKDLSQVT